MECVAPWENSSSSRRRSPVQPPGSDSAGLSLEPSVTLNWGFIIFWIKPRPHFTRCRPGAVAVGAMKRPCEDSSSSDSNVDVGSEDTFPG